MRGTIIRIMRMRTANLYMPTGSLQLLLLYGPSNAVRDYLSCAMHAHSQASHVIVSEFRAALDLDTYPLSNLIRPRCAKRAKRGRGKPVLIMHIGFFACFHAISLERSRFSEIATLFFFPL